MRAEATESLHDQWNELESETLPSNRRKLSLRQKRKAVNERNCLFL